MRQPVWVATLAMTLVAVNRGRCEEPPCSEPSRPCLLQQMAPVGGWHPYGGGLLHWWNPHCFPRGGAPDDYCRKPLPNVCWPPYPPYYTWGPPEICYPPARCNPPCHDPPAP
jgi:hypothetical protein